MTFTERQQRVTNPTGELVFLELSSPSMGAPLLLVNDTQNWVSNGVEYVGFPFDIKLPDDTAGTASRAQLVVDNVGRAITQDLEGLAPGEIIMAKISISDRSDPNVIERTWYMPMSNVSVNPSQAVAQVGVDYLTRQRAVRKVFNPFTSPGIF